jgi:hypothetical protein
VVDACSQTPPSGIIGQTEGTMFLYADIQKFNDSSFYIAISNGIIISQCYLYVFNLQVELYKYKKEMGFYGNVKDLKTLQHSINRPRIN